MNEQSTLITLQALRLFRGDDSARARAAFRQCTQKEMEQEYGQSGRTKAEILADYEHPHAITWFDNDTVPT